MHPAEVTLRGSEVSYGISYSRQAPGHQSRRFSSVTFGGSHEHIFVTETVASEIFIISNKMVCVRWWKWHLHKILISRFQTSLLLLVNMLTVKVKYSRNLVMCLLHYWRLSDCKQGTGCRIWSFIAITWLGRLPPGICFLYVTRCNRAWKITVYRGNGTSLAPMFIVYSQNIFVIMRRHFECLCCNLIFH